MVIIPELNFDLCYNLRLIMYLKPMWFRIVYGIQKQEQDVLSRLMYKLVKLEKLSQ